MATWADLDSPGTPPAGSDGPERHVLAGEKLNLRSAKVAKTNQNCSVRTGSPTLSHT